MKFVALAAAVVLLAACDQPAPVASNVAVPTTANEAGTPAAAPLGIAPGSKEAALKLMHDRHEGMEHIGDAAKLIGRELKADAPDLAKVRDGAATIAKLAPEVTGWFPAGTGPDIGKTRAMPEIWQKPADFAAKRDAFQKQAQVFNAAAQGSDLAATRAAFAELGKTCKACHDPYRAEKGGHD